MGYSIVKGNLFKAYTGTTACTGLLVHKVTDTKEQADKIVQKLLDSNETDLIIIIDLKTGQAA